MKIEMSFAEVSAFVKGKYGQTVVLSKSGAQELCVTYEKRMLFVPVRVPVTLRVDAVTADSVTLTYDGKMGVDLVIKGALTFVKSTLPELGEALTLGDNHQVRVDLGRIPQAQKALQMLALDDIEIQPDRLCVVAHLKA